MTNEELQFLIYGENLFNAETEEEFNYIEENYICYTFDRDEFKLTHRN